MDYNIEKFNNFITKWLNNKGFDVVAKMDTNFSSDITTNTIYYSIIVPQDFDDLFIKEVQKDFPEIIKCDTFLLSLFHELGHIETADYWTDKEWQKYYKFITKPELLDDPLPYFRHPVEWEATKWGCEYIINNSLEVGVFYNTIQELVQEVIDKNHIIL